MILRNFLIKMDPIKEMAMNIVHNLKPENINNIKSHIGFIEICCDIVEEAYQRLKSSKLKISSNYKKNLAVDISSFVLDKLLTDNIIDDKLTKEIQDILENTNIERFSAIIDDVVTIWNDVKVTTLNLCPCLNFGRKRKIRKLENVSDNVGNTKEPSIIMSSV